MLVKCLRLFLIDHAIINVEDRADECLDTKLTVLNEKFNIKGMKRE